MHAALNAAGREHSTRLTALSSLCARSSPCWACSHPAVLVAVEHSAALDTLQRQAADSGPTAGMFEALIVHKQEATHAMPPFATEVLTAAARVHAAPPHLAVPALIVCCPAAGIARLAPRLLWRQDRQRHRRHHEGADHVSSCDACPARRWCSCGLRWGSGTACCSSSVLPCQRQLRSLWVMSCLRGRA